MQRNEITKAGSLQPGDRFYKAGDKKKRVLQMVAGNPKQTQYRTYSLFCYPADIIDNKLMREQLKQRQYSPILKDTAVVYLRSNG